MNKIIGIIGFGNMGSAIARQLRNNYQIIIFDKDKNKTNGINDIQAACDIQELSNKSEVLILAVKPQDFTAVLDEIKDKIKNKLIISIAAGKTCAYIEKILGVVRVVRAMPNILITIGEGLTCLCQGKFASLEDIDFSENIFDFLGETIVIDEKMMNAATSVSGSGPGYCYDLIQAKNIDVNNINEIRNFVKNEFTPQLMKAAAAIGFPSAQAHLLAQATGNGCIGLLKKTKLPPSELVRQVCSKGGTTEAGLEVLHKGGSLEEVVKAALKRAEELSNEN